jgi:putative membrane protein
MWMGGLMVLTRFMKLAAAGSAAPMSADFSKMLKRIYFGFGVGGCVVTLLTGIYQLLARGMQFYMSQGWFHGKLTLVLVAIIITVVIGTLVKAVSAGRSVSAAKVGAMHGIISLILVLAVFSTILGRQ